MQPWMGAPERRNLAGPDFEAAAVRLGCEVAAIQAVWQVEASGRHFLADGSVVRRFEPHHFPRELWPAIGFAVQAGEAPWRASLRLSSEAMFQRAARLDADAAMRASSWGAPQIMGFNAEAAGFGSAGEMVAHMARGAPQQLGAFVQLIEGWGLASALRARDWREFARRYNGSGQVDAYARRLESAYRAHSGGDASPVVLRLGDRGPAVQRLQRALGVQDDGAFGPQTDRAVRAFQRDAGLTVDGVVGARTWAELHATEGAKPPAQPTPLDGLAERVQAVTAPAAAGLGLLEAARYAVPEGALTWIVAGAVGLALIAGTAWAIRYVRAG